MQVRQMLPRVLVLVVTLIALLGGLGAGLARLGWVTPAPLSNWMTIHGPLMIGGFLGTLICMERAVALASRYRWSLIIPAINALGAFVLLLQPDAMLARVLLTLSSAGLLGLFALMLRLHPSRDVWIMALGSLGWLMGNMLWLGGQPVYQVVHLWSAFLILTIVGERLELSRVRRLTRTSERLLIGAVTVYMAGVVVTIVNLNMGIRLLGIGALLLAGWLLRYDVARVTVRQSGLPRYIGMCLLLGYGWLGFGGALALGKGAVYAGTDYSVILHALLLGFVFSMIFGHAPIILPALTGLHVRFHPWFYAMLLWLHLSLIVRVAGEFSQHVVIRQYGGLLNVSAVLLFMFSMAVAVILAHRSPA